jgi:lipopolysaccharide cholinephosphotransferase
MDFAEHHKVKSANGMDQAVARSNLLEIAGILDGLGIGYFLFFGTLLGAVREKGFIAHDTDTDIGVFSEFPARFGEIRAAVEAAGFTVLRGKPGERLFSFMRGNEYLDCYVAKRKFAFPLRHAWDVDGSLVTARFLDVDGRLAFLGREFRVPSEPEKVLAILYGKNWRTPVVRAPAKPSLANRIRRFLREKDKIDALGRHLRISRDALSRKNASSRTGKEGL